MTNHKGKSAWDILGSPDDLKFRSCLTLFAEAASDDLDRMLFKQALDLLWWPGGSSNDGAAMLDITSGHLVLRTT